MSSARTRSALPWTCGVSTRVIDFLKTDWRLSGMLGEGGVGVVVVLRLRGSEGTLMKPTKHSCESSTLKMPATPALVNCRLQEHYRQLTPDGTVSTDTHRISRCVINVEATHLNWLLLLCATSASFRTQTIAKFLFMTRVNTGKTAGVLFSFPFLCPSRLFGLAVAILALLTESIALPLSQSHRRFLSRSGTE